MDWKPLFEGTSAGVAAAIVLGFLALSWNAVRNFRLRREIRKTLKGHGMGSGLSGVTISISNHLRRGFRVREIAIVTSRMAYRLNPTGEVKTSFDGKLPRPTREEKRRIKNGESIEVASDICFAPWKSGSTPQGFTEVAPFTAHSFNLPIQLVKNLKEPVVGVRFIVEFNNFTNGVEILSVEEKKSSVFLQTEIERYQSEIESGSLNDVRAKFGMAPVS